MILDGGGARTCTGALFYIMHVKVVTRHDEIIKLVY